MYTRSPIFRFLNTPLYTGFRGADKINPSIPSHPISLSPLFPRLLPLPFMTLFPAISCICNLVQFSDEILFIPIPSFPCNMDQEL